MSVQKEKVHKKNLWKRILHYKSIYLMLIPALIFFAIFCYGPMYGVLIAFKDFSVTKGILASPWAGFKYFKILFSLPKFWQVLGNTLYISVLKLLICFPAPIVLALLVNEIRNERFKKTMQTVFYLPHFVSWVTLSGIIIMLLSVNGGAVNNLLVSLGFERVSFLTTPSYFRTILISSELWKEVGWGTIIYFAALCGVSPELYEAAILDGASRWQMIRYITIPAITPVITMTFILNVGGLMGSNFDQIFNLYNEMVYEVGDVLSTYTYRVGISNGNFSMATAVGLFTNVVNFILLLASDKIVKKMGGEGIY